MEDTTKIKASLEPLGNYLDQGLFSDWKIVVASKEYKVHRIILTQHSQFFHAHFSSNFHGEEYAQMVTKITCPPGTEKYFPLALKFMYNEYIELTVDNAVPLLSIADMLLMESLMSEIKSYLSTVLDYTSCIVPILLQCVSFNSYFVVDAIERLSKRWAGCVAAHSQLFSKIPVDILLDIFNEPNYVFILRQFKLNSLPIDVIWKMLESSELNVPDEDYVYDIVNEIVSEAAMVLHNQIPEYKKDTIENSVNELKYIDAIKLWSLVRFGFLSEKKIIYAKRNKHIPPTLLKTALEHRELLEFFRNAPIAESTPRNLIPRDCFQKPAEPLLLEYRDERGEEIKLKVKKIAYSYADFFEHIAFRKGWATTCFSYEDVYPMFFQAAYIVVLIRENIDIQNPGIKVRQLDGSARNWMWTVKQKPNTNQSKMEFVRNLVHTTLSDADGYVEGLYYNEINRFVDDELTFPSKIVFDLVKEEGQIFEDKMM